MSFCLQLRRSHKSHFAIVRNVTFRQVKNIWRTAPSELDTLRPVHDQAMLPNNAFFETSLEAPVVGLVHALQCSTSPEGAQMPVFVWSCATRDHSCRHILCLYQIDASPIGFPFAQLHEYSPVVFHNFQSFELRLLRCRYNLQAHSSRPQCTEQTIVPSMLRYHITGHEV